MWGGQRAAMRRIPIKGHLNLGYGNSSNLLMELNRRKFDEFYGLNHWIYCQHG